MSLPATTIRSLENAFGKSVSDDEGNITLDHVREYLIQQIDALLAHQPAQLMSILYRIDVAEPLVQDAINHAPAGELSAKLADLIIERQLLKLKYRDRGGDNTSKTE